LRLPNYAEGARAHDGGRFSRHLVGEVVAHSAALRWPDLYVRHYRFPAVVDRFLP